MGRNIGHVVRRSGLSPVLLVVAIGIAGCGSEPDEDPSLRAAARLDDSVVTVEEVESYLAAILMEEEGDDPLGGREADRVKSRLLDNYLDEEILLLEARRQDIRVDRREVDAYVGVEGAIPDGDSKADEQARRMAERNLMIQKLRGAVVGAEVRVSEAEITTYLGAHRDDLLPGHHLVLRSLAMGGSKEAARIRREILRSKMSFAEAADVFGTAPGQGQPMEIALDELPVEVREAVKGLEPGGVSPPVEYQGTVYLFLVDAWPEKGGVPEEELRARAREELLRVRSEEAADRLLRRLREQTRIKIHLENLPFRYIEE